MEWEAKLKSSSWKSLNISHYDQFSNLLCLSDLILTIPAFTSTGCERGFSVMKNQRTILATPTLSDLIVDYLKAMRLMSITLQRPLLSIGRGNC